MWNSNTDGAHSAAANDDDYAWEHALRDLQQRQNESSGFPTSSTPLGPPAPQVSTSFEFNVAPLNITSEEPLRAWGVAEPPQLRAASQESIGAPVAAKKQTDAGEAGSTSGLQLLGKGPLQGESGKAKLVCPLHKARQLTLWNRKTHRGLCARCVLAGPVDKDDLTDIKDGVLESLRSVQTWCTSQEQLSHVLDAVAVTKTLLTSVPSQDLGPIYETLCDAARLCVNKLSNTMNAGRPEESTGTSLLPPRAAAAEVHIMDTKGPTPVGDPAAAQHVTTAAASTQPPLKEEAVTFPASSVLPAPSDSYNGFTLSPHENRNERRDGKPMAPPPPPGYSETSLWSADKANISIPKPRSTRLPADDANTAGVVRRAPPALPGRHYGSDATRTAPAQSPVDDPNSKHQSRSQKKRAKKKLKQATRTASKVDEKEGSDESSSDSDSSGDAPLPVVECAAQTPHPTAMHDTVPTVTTTLVSAPIEPTPSSTSSSESQSRIHSTDFTETAAPKPLSYLTAIAKHHAPAPPVQPLPIASQISQLPPPPPYSAVKAVNVKGPLPPAPLPAKALPAPISSTQPPPAKTSLLGGNVKATSKTKGGGGATHVHAPLAAAVAKSVVAVPPNTPPIHQEVRTAPEAPPPAPDAPEPSQSNDERRPSREEQSDSHRADDGVAEEMDVSGDVAVQGQTVATQKVVDHETQAANDNEQNVDYSDDASSDDDESSDESIAEAIVEEKSSKAPPAAVASKKTKAAPPPPATPPKKSVAAKKTKPKPLAPPPAAPKKTVAAAKKKKAANDDAFLDEIVRTSSDVRETAAFSKFSTFRMPPGVYFIPFKGPDGTFHTLVGHGGSSCFNVELFKKEYETLNATDQLKYLSAVDDVTAPVEGSHALLSFRDPEKLQGYKRASESVSTSTHLHYIARALMPITIVEIRAGLKSVLSLPAPPGEVLPSVASLRRMQPLLRYQYTWIGFQDSHVTLTRQHTIQFAVLEDDRKAVDELDELARVQPYAVLMHLLCRDIFVTTRCGSVMKYITLLLQTPLTKNSHPLYNAMAAYHYASFGDMMEADKWVNTSLQGPPPQPHERLLFLKFLGEACVRQGRLGDLQTVLPRPTEVSFYANCPMLVDCAMTAYSQTDNDEVRNLMVHLYGRSSSGGPKKSLGYCIADELWASRVLTAKLLPGDKGIDNSGPLFDICCVGDKEFEQRLLAEVVAPVLNIGTRHSSLSVRERRSRVEKLRSVANLTAQAASSRTQSQGIDLFLQVFALLEHQIIVEGQQFEGADILETLWKTQQSIMAHHVTGRVETRFIEDVEKLLQSSKQRYRFWTITPPRAGSFVPPPSQVVMHYAVQYTFTYIWDHMELIATVRRRPAVDDPDATDVQLLSRTIVGSHATRVSDEAMMVLFTDSALVRALGNDICHLDNIWREHIPHIPKAVASDCRHIMNRNPGLYQRAYDDLHFCLDVCYELFIRPAIMPIVLNPKASRKDIRAYGELIQLVVIGRGIVDVLPFHMFHDVRSSTYLAEQCVLSRAQSIANLSMAHLLREYNDDTLHTTKTTPTNFPAKLFTVFDRDDALTESIQKACPHGAKVTYFQDSVSSNELAPDVESAQRTVLHHDVVPRVAELAVKKETRCCIIEQNRLTHQPLLRTCFLDAPGHAPVVLDVLIRPSYEREAVLSGGFLLEDPHRHVVTVGVELVMWRSLTLAPLVVCTRAGVGMPSGPAAFPDTRPGLHRCLLLGGTSRVLIPWRVAAEYVDDVSLRIARAALQVAQETTYNVSRHVRKAMLVLMDEGHSVNTWGAFSFYGVD